MRGGVRKLREGKSVRMHRAAATKRLGAPEDVRCQRTPPLLCCELCIGPEEGKGNWTRKKCLEHVEHHNEVGE